MRVKIDPSSDSGAGHGAGNGRNQKSGQTDTELGLLVDDNIFQQTSAATVGTASRVSTDSTLLLDREIHCIAMFTLCPVTTQHKEGCPLPSIEVLQLLLLI